MRRGDVFDQWDLELHTGLFSRTRGLLTIEEYGSGKQYVIFKTRIRFHATFATLILLLSALTLWSAWDGIYLVSVILGALSLFLLLKFLSDCSHASYLLNQAFLDLSKKEEVQADAATATTVTTSSPFDEDELEEEGAAVPTPAYHLNTNFITSK